MTINLQIYRYNQNNTKLMLKNRIEAGGHTSKRNTLMMSYTVKPRTNHRAAAGGGPGPAHRCGPPPPENSQCFVYAPRIDCFQFVCTNPKIKIYGVEKWFSDKNDIDKCKKILNSFQNYSDKIIQTLSFAGKIPKNYLDLCPME